MTVLSNNKVVMQKKRVRTLLRVSSNQQLQGANYDDLPVQRAEVDNFIRNHNDWVFDNEYMEGAISAYKNNAEERDVLQEILVDAKNREFDVLLSYYSDRIGRLDEYYFYVLLLNRLGIEVWTVNDGQLKTTEHIDKLMTYIRFWQNEGESRKTSARVRDAQMEHVKTGKFIGGKAPYGYDLVYSGVINKKGRALKKLVIIPEHAEIVKKIFDYAINQGMGYMKIAKALNEEGIESPSNKTKEWKQSTIASILKNPIYMGYIAYNRRITHNGEFNRQDRQDWIYSEKQNLDITIIEPKKWEKAQEIRESRKSQIAAAKSENSKTWHETHHYPFSTKGTLPLIGLVYCGYCGKKVKNGSYCNRWKVKSTGEEKVSFAGRYTCPEHHEERRSYSQNYLEGIVFEVLELYMENLKHVNISDELLKMQESHKKALESKLMKNQKEQKNMLMDIKALRKEIPKALREESKFNEETLSELISECEENYNTLLLEEITIKEELKNANVQNEVFEKFVSQIPNWKEEFEKANVQTKAMILASIIDKIIVKDDDIKIIFKIRLEDFLPKTIDNGTILCKLDSM